ncbi:MAG: AAA family ATPase, partial [Ruminococcaceae bacterium]|nr:AAA family ATPase [Oscillospiraceae bacterium]
MENIKRIYTSIMSNAAREIVGKESVAELAVISLLCGGHMLL